MEDWQSRTRLLLGNERLQRLQQAHILVVGVGGVGAYAAEMLCRAGVGTLTIVDGDVVSHSNRNRQLLALTSTIGLPKVEIMAARLRDINPEIKINLVQQYLRDEEFDTLLAQKFDYVVDAIDTLLPKVNFIEKCLAQKLRVVSSMGAGGRLDPTKIEVADIDKSHHCPLAYMLRKRLHQRGIRTDVKVVFSPEAIDPRAMEESHGEQNKKTTVGTISYMPAVFG
ncbi:MAG: tRNA threonylcarbamoyladenosine dehydratase, partial [Prevotellaceae bacterium]|nr:tRNA threonylcarbamoyladenosine dehydratase [Prevotellaceae bacterium]